ncbi:hypothetical protein SNE510_75550 [Streptomyces sp. NE5-10]|nr:hypothetical protein SNE510_75550 [Streptomyces sp. NE5-10]
MRILTEIKNRRVNDVLMLRSAEPRRAVAGAAPHLSPPSGTDIRVPSPGPGKSEDARRGRRLVLPQTALLERAAARNPVPGAALEADLQSPRPPRARETGLNPDRYG